MLPFILHFSVVFLTAAFILELWGRWHDWTWAEIARGLVIAGATYVVAIMLLLRLGVITY